MKKTILITLGSLTLFASGMIAQASVASYLSSAASALSQAQYHVPQSDYQSVSDLDEAYQLISGVQARYQGQ